MAETTETTMLTPEQIEDISRLHLHRPSAFRDAVERAWPQLQAMALQLHAEKQRAEEAERLWHSRLLELHALRSELAGVVGQRDECALALERCLRFIDSTTKGGPDSSMVAQMRAAVTKARALSPSPIAQTHPDRSSDRLSNEAQGGKCQ